MAPRHPARTIDSPKMTKHGRGDKSLPGNDHLHAEEEWGEFATPKLKKHESRILGSRSFTSHPGGNLVDGLPPAASFMLGWSLSLSSSLRLGLSLGFGSSLGLSLSLSLSLELELEP